MVSYVVDVEVYVQPVVEIEVSVAVLVFINDEPIAIILPWMSLRGQQHSLSRGTRVGAKSGDNRMVVALVLGADMPLLWASAHA